MPSARTGPDQKHALEALWRKWVFLSFGIDRLDALVVIALPKLVGALDAEPYAASGSR